MKSIIHILQIILEWLVEIIFFPLWWYSKGFLWFAGGLMRYLGDEFTGLAIGVWLKNLFVPMYGQRDIAGFLISFFIRLVQVIFRSIFWLLLAIVVFALIIVWLGLPVLLIAGFFMSANGNQINFLIPKL
ncbi:MAG: hypothetical protein PHR00_01990 [Patescibacteria group bacterium]|nr:hypothetical protein [Patescibacteria group bacterium]